MGIARIKLGLADKLLLGNMAAKRDWGHAADYVRAMYLMLQQDSPEDFVVATGETHSITDFCELAFGEVGLDYRDYVAGDEKFFRPAEVDLLIGDPSLAREKLIWKQTYTFPQLVSEMVRSDVAQMSAKRGHSTKSTSNQNV